MLGSIAGSDGLRIRTEIVVVMVVHDVDESQVALFGMKEVMRVDVAVGVRIFNIGGGLGF